MLSVVTHVRGPLVRTKTIESMFGWIVNREFEQTGLIPEEVLELDDLVLAGNREELTRIFDEVNTSCVAQEYQSKASLLKADDMTFEQIASWCWFYLKKEPNPWSFIKRTGKYSSIFE